MTGPAMHMLFVDDNPGDQELAREAILQSARGTQLHTASDGVEALEFLRNTNTPRPDMVLLDLNMPRKDGIETLKEIRQDETLKTIHVIIFSSSTAPEDHNLASRYSANSYFIKPLGLEDFMQTIAMIESDWWNERNVSAGGRA